MTGASIAPGTPQGALAQPQLRFHLHQIKFSHKRWLKRRERWEAEARQWFYGWFSVHQRG